MPEQNQRTELHVAMSMNSSRTPILKANLHITSKNIMTASVHMLWITVMRILISAHITYKALHLHEPFFLFSYILYRCSWAAQ